MGTPIHYVLHKSIKNGYIIIIRAISFLPINFNRKYNGSTPLESAIKANNTKIVKELLKIQAVKNGIIKQEIANLLTECFDTNTNVTLEMFDALELTSGWPRSSLEKYSHRDINNAIRDGQIKKVKDLLKKYNITSINYDKEPNNNIIDMIINILISPEHNITNLSIPVPVSNDSLIYLAEALTHQNCKVKKLSLVRYGENYKLLDDNAIQALVQAVNLKTKIEYFNLSGINMLEDNMKKCTSLTFYSLRSKITEFVFPSYDVDETNKRNVKDHAKYYTKNNKTILSLVTISPLRKLPPELIHLLAEMMDDPKPAIKINFGW